MPTKRNRLDIWNLTELLQQLVVLPFVDHLVVDFVQFYITKHSSFIFTTFFFIYFRILHCLHFLQRQQIVIKIASNTTPTNIATIIIQTRKVTKEEKKIKKNSSFQPTIVFPHLPLKCISLFKHFSSRQNETVLVFLSQ